MSENWERLLPRVVAGGILLILALGVLSLRLHRITELPQGIQSDKGPDGVYALQALQGEHAVFFPEAASGREWMGVYAIALSTSALGRSILAFRWPTALASAVTVFAVFWLGRLFFGREGSGRPTPWRGLFIGGVGAGVLAVSLGQTIIGRASLRANNGGGSLWVALQWQTETGLETDFAISLRVKSADGQTIYQTDHVLGDSTFARTRDWFADLPVDTLFHLDLPADLPPGENELNLIVYNTETLIPTVEIDVWKPELLLTHLLLQESGRQE